MRTINLIVVHCSATQGNRTLSPEENTVGTQSKLNYLKNEKGGKMMAMKKSVWDMILKVVIAVASAVAGVLGANAMSL